MILESKNDTITIRTLPPVTLPQRYKQETDKQYSDRVYRWRCWKNNEPRPDLWYVSDNEVKEYKQWLTISTNKSRDTGT